MIARHDARFLILLLVAVFFGPLYFALSRDLALTGWQLALSAVIACAAAAYYQKPDGSAIRALLTLLMILCLPLFYGVTGKVISAMGRARRDDALFEADRWMFGSLFPDGQISFWFDQSRWLHPGTMLGRILTEFLQIMYFSYYVWGFALLGYLIYRWGTGLASRGGVGADQIEHRWRNLRLFLGAWVGTFLVNFLGYLWLPAIGPQFVLADQYTHSLEGLWVAKHLRVIVSSGQGTLEDCFPSGHTAMSWVAGLYAIRLAPRYGRFALAAAPAVTFATIYLRYHYIVDLLAAIPLIAIALWWGGWRSLGARRILEK